MVDRDGQRPASGAGSVVVIAGPDGAGKTAVAQALYPALAGPVLWLHHRPGVLPTRAADSGPVTDPHRNPPYGRTLSVAKVFYLFFDYLLGWRLRLLPIVRTGGTVLLERGWWDLLVDPRRYRLDVPSSLLRRLGRLLPTPRLTVVLGGDAATIAARKQELTDAELHRQLRAWAQVPEQHGPLLRLDATGSLEESVERILAALGGDSPPGPRVSLPSRRNARLDLPAAPRAVAREALRVYHPVTPVGRLAWRSARAYAGSGGLNLLASSCPPEPAVVRLVGPLTPTGCLLSLARANHPGRWTVLVLRPDGALVAVAKVAIDDDGPAALQHERAAATQFGERLSTRVRTPRVLGHTERVLLFEPVAWRPRRRPWHLAPVVAAALGELFATTPDRSLGPCHGDMAPWNLLRSGQDWFLIDWADSREAAMPFFDVLHFLVQSHALLGRPRLDALARGLDGDGWVGAALRAYAMAAGRPDDDPRWYLRDYLEESAAGLDPTVADQGRGLAARRRLLAELG